MSKTKKDFKIINLVADSKNYYPASMRKTRWMGENYVKHTKIQIPLGHSRYGGVVIDLPKELKHPKGLRFAAQLDLATISPLDPTGLLPKTGHLYFFADLVNDKGKV